MCLTAVVVRTQGDFIMEKGEWNHELLILSKGSARTPDKGDDGRYTTFDVGAFWGEMGVSITHP
jgi:hypothetical protein